MGISFFFKIEKRRRPFHFFDAKILQMSRLVVIRMVNPSDLFNDFRFL